MVGSGLLAGCSGGSDGADDPYDGLIEVAEPTPIVFDPSDPPELAGRMTDPSAIEAGDCFNEYLFRDGSGFRQHLMTIVGCDGPHDHEAYFSAEFPGGEAATFPRDDELERWADTTCLDEFSDFIGLDYVLSALEIGAIVPTFASWSDGDRTVVCYVFPDEGGRLLNSVRDSGI